MRTTSLRIQLTALALALLSLPAFAQTPADTTTADTTREARDDRDGFDWGLLGLLGLLGLIPRKRHDTHTHTHTPNPTDRR